MKTKLRAILPPAIFLAITYYFGWNAIHGKSGLEAQSMEKAQLAQAQRDFAQVDAQRTQWQTKVNDLSSKSVVPDMLDAQARRVLNLANPKDLVINLPPTKPKE